MAHASVAYISASTNRYNHAADSSSSSLIAFGSGRLVCLWDVAAEQNRGVSETLPGHKGLVTCVRFIWDDFLASADDQGQLRCWRKIGHQWTCTGTIQGHGTAVSSLCTHEQYLASGSSDAQVKIWNIIAGSQSDELKEIQSIDLTKCYPLSLALTSLPGSKASILAIGGTDRSVQIWIRSEDIFVRSALLSGHEDWVRSLAFRPPASSEESLVLASGSQDNTIRLWNFERFTKNSSPSRVRTDNALSDELLDAFEASLGDLADAEEGGRQISLKRHILTVKSDQGRISPRQFSVTFDALLIGHEAGVTSLCWRPPLILSTTPTLLSTSTDSSLILWSPSTVLRASQDVSTSIWVNRQRFGDIGGQRLGGFVGGVWARSGMESLAWGWAGGWRRWRCSEDYHSGAEEIWHEISAIGGHDGPIKGLNWSPNGEYLISVGLDQTTRIHGEIPERNVPTYLGCTWHELSRPQVHGYDLLDVVFLDPLKFVSVADEKVARVFEAPRGFVDTIRLLGVAELADDQSQRPVAASVPPLGLSNKAVSEASSLITVPRGSNPPARCPHEAELASVTLWPEIEKIFGHGYELMSLAVSKSRRLIATACKATTVEHAVVRVYDTKSWQLVGKPLEGHSLTVTRIAFSPDDRFVLTVSRDRSWRLFEATADSGYVPAAANKSHSRIIWDCAWSHEGDIFATASRDKTVKIWQARVDKWTAAATVQMKDAATAIAFAPINDDARRRLAIGLESGEIHVHSSALNSPSEWRVDLVVAPDIAHVDHINRLAWQPTGKRNSMRLASCSEDGTLKVLIVHETEMDVNDNP